MKTQTPTKGQYEDALKIVQQYEERQRQLKHLEKELNYRLSKFYDVKFKIDKKKGEVLFAGVYTGNPSDEVLVGKSQCSPLDKFETVIGKLIAVKSALHEDVSDVVKMVESNIFMISNTINTGAIVSSPFKTHTLI